MFTAAELLGAIEARQRRRFPLHAERAFGEFPPTWRQWFLAMEARADAVTGAPAQDWIAPFLQRPLRAPPKAAPPLGRLHALALLAFRQRWGPAPREERGLRMLSAAISAVTHVVLIFLFFWVALIRIEARPATPDAAGEVTLVEFIGEGTPETPGDAAPQTALQEAREGESTAASSRGDDAPAAQSDAGDPQAEIAASDPSAASSPAAEVESEPVPQSASVADPAPVEDVSLPVPPPAQPLVVTEVAQPDTSFTLPPTTLRLPDRPAPVLRTPEPSSSAVDVRMIERDAAVRALPLPQTRPLPMPEATPTPPSREVALIERPTARPQALPIPQRRAANLPDAPAPTASGREIALIPRPQASAPARALPDAPARRLPDAPTPGAGREVPLRTAPTAATGANDARPTGSAPTPAGRPAASGTTAQGATRTPAPATAGRPGGTATAGAGPRPATAPGGLQTPVRGDDWGVSERNRPGSGAGREGGSGLFNADGSVRLPGDGGRVGGGLPPGTITEDFAKIDRMGTWLKRPPADYTPSRFDTIYVPHENLLQEWVRRNVREVFVPIPGTGKRLRCVVSLLQAAGGCTIDDPNLRDQEAEARPPPTVPYKPELQEGR